MKNHYKSQIKQCLGSLVLYCRYAEKEQQGSGVEILDEMLANNNITKNTYNGMKQAVVNTSKNNKQCQKTT